MTLGEKIKAARLEAGLSQRQLCGDTVTRNMLSQIENGAAQPSMATLTAFAGRLGKPVSYFLEEHAVASCNQEVMAKARAMVLAGNGAEALEILADYRRPDEIFDAEFQLLSRLSMLDAAEFALKQGQKAYAAELLEKLDDLKTGYCAEELERKRLLLLAQARPQLRGQICGALPTMDTELLLRARYALDAGEFDRCQCMLGAAQDQNNPEWNFLQAELHLALGCHGDAVGCYHKAEAAYPEKTARRLEYCYRELGDFKQAYFYACKQREFQIAE